MTIKVGDKVPSATLTTFGAGRSRADQHRRALQGQDRGPVRGAGRLHADLLGQAPAELQDRTPADLKAKGVDTIACVSVNDVFVMKAWGDNQSVGEDVLMLADGNGDFTKALGLELDASRFGMGPRSQRYSMIVKDGVVTELNVESGGEYRVSSAEYMLEQL